MMQVRKATPRAQHRLRQTERIQASASLAEKFPGLKSLTANLEYYEPAGLVRNGGMKYKPNLEKAKSLLCFDCPNGECVGGDFDLSHLLAHAIGASKTVVAGELRCQGMRHKPKQEPTKCSNILRYELRLVYEKATANHA
jgi:ribosomal protein S30